MIKAVLIDFDDTLCYTNIIFDRKRQEFNDMMKELDMWDEELNDVVNRFDIMNVNIAGRFLSSCFPDSLGQAYECYCYKYRKPYDASLRQKAIEIGRSVFIQPTELMPDAEWLLRELSKDYPLYLVTHGDIEVQEGKVARSGLQQFFDKLYFLRRKSPSEYMRIAEENGIAATDCLMLGNSLRYDVEMALEAGMHAVYLVSDSWNFDNSDITEGFQTVYSLKEAYAAIKGE